MGKNPKQLTSFIYLLYSFYLHNLIFCLNIFDFGVFYTFIVKSHLFKPLHKVVKNWGAPIPQLPLTDALHFRDAGSCLGNLRRKVEVNILLSRSDAFKICWSHSVIYCSVLAPVFLSAWVEFTVDWTSYLTSRDLKI